MIEFKTGVIRPVECFREGWELIKDQYWLFLGITLVGILIYSFVPFGILMGPMFCGIYFALFQKMNGEQVRFENLFKGFDYFLPAFIASLFIIVPTFVFTIVLYVPMFAMQMSLANNKNARPDDLFGYFGFLIGGVFLMWLVVGSIHALLMFAFPLIVEYKLSGVEAFKLSARAVWENLGGVVGLIVCEFVLGLLGLLACYFGVFFVMPIMFAGVLVAYRKVFPPMTTISNFNVPPPPSAFEGAGRYN